MRGAALTLVSLLGACADAPTLQVEFDARQPDARWEAIFEQTGAEPVAIYGCTPAGYTGARNDLEGEREDVIRENAGRRGMVAGVRASLIESREAGREGLRARVRAWPELAARGMPGPERNALPRSYLDMLRLRDAEFDYAAAGRPIVHAAEVAGADRRALEEAAPSARIVEPGRMWARGRVRNLYTSPDSPCTDVGGVPMDLTLSDEDAARDLAQLRRELGMTELDEEAEP